MFLSVLVLVALDAPQAEVRVVGPGRPNEQTPATMVVEPAAMLIVACDGDADARTTRGELDACLQRGFGVSANLGYLDYARWQARWLGDQGALPSPLEVDRDGDNRVSLAELQAQFSRLFSRLDKDADSGVSRAEALTIRAFAAGEAERRGRPRAQPIPGGQPPATPPR